MIESVNCTYCGRDTSITEDTTCKCGVELLTTQALRLQITSFEAQITGLRLQQGKAVSEVCRRERLRNAKRDGFHVSNVAFWQNVHGKPAWSAREKSPRTQRQPNIDMSAFD
jgi:hypothetical protein